MASHKKIVALMSTFQWSSLVVPLGFVMTTCGADSEGKVDIMETLSFQCWKWKVVTLMNLASPATPEVTTSGAPISGAPVRFVNVSKCPFQRNVVSLVRTNFCQTGILAYRWFFLDWLDDGKLSYQHRKGQY